MIKFEDFFSVKFPKSTKVKFNMNNGNTQQPAWDFLRDDAVEWINMNSWKSKQPNNNLNKAEYVLSFAQYYPYGPNFYIFGGLYKVEKKQPEVYDQVGYNLTLMDDFSEYRKRLIIRLDKTIGRDLYNRWFENVQSSLNPEVYELAPSTKLGSFPGYSNVLLSHKDLQLIINREEPEWKNALANVKGVYCITDTSTGQLYSGSASGVYSRSGYAPFVNYNINQAISYCKNVGTGFDCLDYHIFLIHIHLILVLYLLAVLHIFHKRPNLLC